MHGRLEYLDGLRGLAALCVVLGHCAMFSEEATISTPPNQGLRVFMYASSLSVPLFIILSGFCLTLPLLREGGMPGGWGGFFRRRAWRILPVYYFALAISLVYGLLGSHAISHREIFGFMPNFLGPLLLIHDAYGSPATDHPLWSIAVEWHIYFLFPLVVVAWRKYGMFRTLLTAVPLSYIATAVAQHNNGGSLHLYLYGLFVLGMGVAWVCFSPNPNCRALRAFPGWPSVWAGAFAAFVSYCILLGWDGYLATEHCVDMLWAGYVCCLLMALASPAPFWLRNVFLSRPMQAVGACSYSLYAVHWVVVIAVNAVLRPLGAHLSNAAYFATLAALALPGSLAAAAVTYFLVERPSLRARRRSAVPTETMPGLESAARSSPGTLI